MIDSQEAQALLDEAQRCDELARSALVERLAVMGTFDPKSLHGAEAFDVVRLLCDHLPSQEVTLRERHRIDAMVRMLERGGHDELVRIRRSIEPQSDGALQRMLDAFVLDDGEPLEQRDEDELLASMLVWRWATEATARAGRTLDTPIEPGKDAIESQLALLDVTRAIRRLASAGCVGRKDELARLHEYRRARPKTANFEVEPPMIVYGVGGVGKSTLVARFAMDLYEERANAETGVWAYLDLDRPTLASCEADVILDDIIHQVAAQRPDERRKLLRDREIKRRRRKGAGLEAVDTASSYRQPAVEFIHTMREISGGTLLVVLDTYEQLERNEPYQQYELEALFALMAAELPHFRLVVSGRTPAAVFVDPNRPDRLMHVEDFDEDAALELLRFFVAKEAHGAERPVGPIEESLGRDVVALVGGIPLTLRLAARVLVEEDLEAIENAAARARTLDRVRHEFVRGFLYQRILEHLVASPPVNTENLRLLARAGIALRRITVELVEQVLVPLLPAAPSASPIMLFAALASEITFFEEDGGALRLREELRGSALAALEIDDAALVRRVHERAAAFYADSTGDAASKVEFAYHRLALGAQPVEFDESTLRQLEPVMTELPVASAARIRDVVGDHPVAPADHGLESWERKALPVVDGALRDGRLRKARELLNSRTERTLGSELHRLESRLTQAEGDIRAAVAAAERDLRAASAAGKPTRYAAAAVRVAGLHEFVGDARKADDALRETCGSSLIASRHELRLQVLLNRMNTRERMRIDDTETRWLLGLEARSLMQRSDPRELASNTALVRLLAAALGQEEPDRIREAVRHVGLGHEEDPARVQAVITSLAAWDMSMPEPGSLAKRYLRLENTEPESIVRAWTALAGLGTDAGLLLDMLWRQITPPEDVCERLRDIYLWWAVDVKPKSSSAQPDRGPRQHFLTELPIDWSRTEILSLEELMLTAYPTSQDCMMIASKAGLDLTLISWASSGRRITREILGSAKRAGKLEQLVETVLTDPDAISVREPLRALVGADWLSAHGL